MGTKIKGMYNKGIFKYISQIFVKEREMEIGHPTDVKHVAHIGCDSQSSNAPSWMNEYKTASGFSASSLSNLCEPADSSCFPVSTWSSQDFEQSMARQPASEIFRDSPPTELPKPPKKHSRKKAKSYSFSPNLSSWSSSSSKTSRAIKPKVQLTTTVEQSEIKPSIPQQHHKDNISNGSVAKTKNGFSHVQRIW